LERKLGLVSILVGAFWLASSIAALIFGLTFIGGTEDTILAPVNVTLDTIDKVYNDIVEFKIVGIPIGKVAGQVVKPIKTAIKEPLEALRNSIERVFTTIKLVYTGVTTWLALPQILLIYTGLRLRKLGSKRLRR